MSGRLGAIGASYMSTLWYNPQKNGAATGRIGVYTDEHDYIEVGLRLYPVESYST